MADYRCSFCGKHQDQVKKLIAGGGQNRPYICDECISLCKEIIDEDLSGTPRPEPQARTRSKGLFARLRRRMVALPR